MPEKYPQPRWGLLYLALPLATGLFWVIARMHVSGAERDIMMAGALFIVGGYVEAWRLANAVALLRHPLTDNPAAPIYYVQSIMESRPARAKPGVRAVLVTDAYDDLFSMPVYIREPSPPALMEEEKA
jgi:hypothetical protein